MLKPVKWTAGIFVFGLVVWADAENGQHRHKVRPPVSTFSKQEEAVEDTLDGYSQERIAFPRMHGARPIVFDQKPLPVSIVAVALDQETQITVAEDSAGMSQFVLRREPGGEWSDPRLKAWLKTVQRPDSEATVTVWWSADGKDNVQEVRILSRQEEQRLTSDLHKFDRLDPTARRVARTAMFCRRGLFQIALQEYYSKWLR